MSEAELPRVELVRAEDPEEAAGQHHPLEADVHDAAALGEHAADRREGERRREDEHVVDQHAPVDDARRRTCVVYGAVQMRDARRWSRRRRAARRCRPRRRATQPSLRSPRAAAQAPQPAATAARMNEVTGERSSTGGSASHRPRAARPSAGPRHVLRGRLGANRASGRQARACSRGGRLGLGRSPAGLRRGLLPQVPDVEEQQVGADEEQDEPLDDRASGFRRAPARSRPGSPGSASKCPAIRAPKRSAASGTPIGEFRPRRATAIPMKPICETWMSRTPRRNCQPRMSIAPARPANVPEIAIAST